MKLRTFILCALVVTGCASKTEMKPVDYVDPFIGTGGHGHNYPGATTPFGAVQLSPDNYRGDWDACSGYHYSQKEIIGFSHTHLSGTGCADLADILFHPTSKDVDLSREGDIFDYLPYKHRNETATPGYYSVYFHKDRIKAELSATTHTGWHRYTWAKGAPHNLIIDMHHGITDEKIQEVEIFQTSPTEIRGMRKTTAWVPDQYIYFVAQFSREIESIRYIDGHKEVAGADECKTDDRQVILSFGDGGGQVVAKVGVSIVGYDGAEHNLVSECGDHVFDFDRVSKEASIDWNRKLSNIAVSGGTEKQKRIFYTSLYHTLVVPNITSDEGKLFRRNNGQISRVYFGKHFFSTMSLWDTFRAWLPLTSITSPTELRDMVFSCFDMYQATGELPIWPLSSGETDCMIGYHSIPLIVDAFMKGIATGMDVDYALDAMVKSSNINENGSDYYTTLGYIPANRRAESVSTMLEYCYDDWCIARFADYIGRQDVADEYYRRAKNYVNVFDGSTGFFRGKNTDGTFVEPFNTFDPTREYTEATPWQYRYFVPHDFTGLADLLGGRDSLSVALDRCLSAKSELEGEKVDITGLIGQYAHGNEPSHHMAYIYNYVGEPWKTEELTRRICAEMYDDTPDGLCGNEDCGQMSAWYVMTALGLYEVCPGTNQFTLTTPMFESATVCLPNGKMLDITANDPARNAYIQKVTLNGEEITKAYIDWGMLLSGGELHFELGSKPAEGLWASPDAAPYSMSTARMVSKPWFSGSDSPAIFRDSVEVTLGCLTPGAEVRYTLDGSTPSRESALYTAPFRLTDNTIVRAVAYKDGFEDSAEMSVQFTKAVFVPADHSAHSEHGVNYTYWHGDFKCTDDIDTKGEYVKSGKLDRPDLSPADQEDYYGFIYTGWIYIPETRIWTFSLICDDGGVLYIGDNLVVDNDGTHSPSHVTGKVPLEEGYYPYTLKYLESYEGQELVFGWWPTGSESMVEVPNENLYTE